ncbi:MAG: hypothetical protein ACJAS1_006255 [Oleiphilaceae bacterium]|jgi:hypothetical protein
MKLPFHCPILPDEHLLGWIFRIHLLLGYPKIVSTLKVLGIQNEALRHNQYNRAFLDVINFYRQEVEDGASSFDMHTLFPMWSLGTSPAYYSQWRNNNTANIQNGKIGGRLLCNQKWKYCYICADEDIKKYGVSLWHTKHQILSLTHCVKHKVPLVEHNSYNSDLRHCFLPVKAKGKDKQIEACAEMLKWSMFVNTVYETLRTDPLAGAKLIAKVRKAISMPVNLELKGDNIDKFDDLQQNFDSEMPTSITSYLFPNYSKHKVYLFRTTMGFYHKGDVREVTHPVYWLAIIYWLRHELGFTRQL